MGAVLLLPFQIRRQFAGPIDPDEVFATTADRTAYLTNPRRYAGMVVSDLEASNIYMLNAAGTAWLTVGGGSTSGLNDIIEFTPGDVGFPAVGATTYVSAALANKKVLVIRSGTVQRGTDPGDGTTYVTKVLASTTLTFSHALIATDYIQIIVITP